MSKPEAKAVVKHMMANDAFSQWLGIEILEAREGYCKLQMTMRKEMTNGFNIAHGGISYSLADSALAFASNDRGDHALSIETSIAHTRPAHTGELLFAEAIEKSHTKRFGIYEIQITNERGELIALFKGTVYRTGKEWNIDKDNS
jgi:acyl-CoA thioesterase